MKVRCLPVGIAGVFPVNQSLFLVLFFFASLHLIRAQCPAGDITLTTQAQVDNFTTTFPGCTHMLGSLTIGPSADIVNLNGLAGVLQIDGNLVITGNTVLTDATGLGGVTSIGTGINIQNNPVLGIIDLSGASALNVSSMNVQNNASLTSALLPTDVTSIQQ
ncbi:MAG: hypothetical protein KDD14_10410, partial [Saprospiraceae bacterium]|nr:hypothetical protein [Saprospiraceae bacterium]